MTAPANTIHPHGLLWRRTQLCLLASTNFSVSVISHGLRLRRFVPSIKDNADYQHQCRHVHCDSSSRSVARLERRARVRIDWPIRGGQLSGGCSSCRRRIKICQLESLSISGQYTKHCTPQMCYSEATRIFGAGIPFAIYSLIFRTMRGLLANKPAASTRAASLRN